MLSIAPDNAAPVQQQVWTIVCGLVHDLRQPLSVIDACADYLNLVVPDTNLPAHRQLELLQQQVSEANRVMHDALLELHHGDAPQAGYAVPRDEECAVAARR
jgi:signal transduction histidine kinase